MREVLFVAGEASGDLHASRVAAELAALRPDLAMRGVGGDRMREAGVALDEHVERLAVMGFVEVLRHVPKHAALLRTLRARIEGGRVRLVVLVDYPGFNMRVAAAIAKTVRKAAVILPFEERLLRAHGVDATFVGHPLLDRAQDMPARGEARRSLGLPEDAPVLALFPGSRAQEIHRHLGDFVDTARELEKRVPGLRTIVSVAPTVTLDESRVPYPMVRSASFTVLRAATAAMAKSGTTTLEAAVAGCPMVVAYRTNALTYAIARRLVKIPHIGLVNVVAGREVAPEFVQDALTPGAVADALEPLLDEHHPRRASMLAELRAVRGQLGTPGAARRVAQMASDLVGE